MRYIALAGVCAFLLTACQGDRAPTDVGFLPVGGPALSVDDGSFGGNPHFYFLPPLVDQPSFSGEVNGDLRPVVRICPSPSDCGAGAGVLEERADLRGNHYQFKWRTSRGEAGSTLRVMVVIGETKLGHIDVRLERRVRGSGRPEDPTDDATVQAGRTVAIKFRIEVGALCGTDAESCGAKLIEADEGGTVNADEGLGFQVEANGLTQDATVIIERIACPTDENGLINYLPIDLPQFGGCFKLRAEPPTAEIVDAIGATVGSCPDAPNLSAAQTERLLIHRDDGQKVQALPNADAPFVNCDAFADAGLSPVIRWARRGWRTLRRTVNPLAARPAYAAHRGFGGKTIEFSDYVWALPAQMEALAGTEDQTAPPNTPVANPPGVLVTDKAGDLVENARVSFQVTLGDGVLERGADQATLAGGETITVITGPDGRAVVDSWTLGTDVDHESTASGRGIGSVQTGGQPFDPELAASSGDPLELETGVVTFTATTGTGLPIDYGADGYRYLQVPPNQLPEGFTDVNFDDSGWPVGSAPFWQDPSGTGGTNCTLTDAARADELGTNWDVNTQILLRKRFVLSSAIGVTISVAIDNDIRVFLNGQELTDGFQTHEGCPQLDNFSYAAQGGPGENALVIQARDRGVISYVNVRVEQSQ